ncbi:MAG: LysR family transcriptional regulator [Hyphomicrobiales bacterium]|jgi:DNA-binding transcriptional LysR family regulator|nr:LysR family transcriptional regulator [Hyphomicrobiales bacterium]
MDTEQARTFLTIIASGNFVAAADRLHVSQSTVSARIQALEDFLRCRLFVRNKAGATLTPAGRRFQRHATSLVQTVEHARQDIGLPGGVLGNIVIGARIGLWEHFLLRWLPLMQSSRPDLSIRAESALEPELIQGLIERRIDIGIMYTPQNRPGLRIEELFEDRLILVSTDPHGPSEPGPGYVYVDWGPEFYNRHSALFPDFKGALLTANIGWLGLQYVLAEGGSGYFPARVVRSQIAAGHVHAISGAPEFLMPAYVASVREREDATLAQALTLLHALAAATKSDAI